MANSDILLFFWFISQISFFQMDQLLAFINMLEFSQILPLKNRYDINQMKNELIVGVITALLAGAALFSYNAQLNNNELAQFEEFKTTYGKIYTLEENVYRFGVFITNLKKINQHNADKTQTYTMGVNQFTDMTNEEFAEKILMKNIASSFEAILVEDTYKSAADDSVDWRGKGVLNDVKNQGQCGSCWAFSTTGTLESNWAVAKKQLKNFAEQQLVDCCGVKGYQCQGCQGAWPEWALNYVNNAGIAQTKDYSYTAVQGTCKSNVATSKILNSAKPWMMFKENDESGVKGALSKSGPVSVCVDASNWAPYRSGVFSNCGKTNLNHAVTAVGYQADGVWIVRNSWGASWGDSGHIRLATGNTCGILAHAVVPNLA